MFFFNLPTGYFVCFYSLLCIFARFCFIVIYGNTMLTVIAVNRCLCSLTPRYLDFCPDRFYVCKTSCFIRKWIKT